MSLPVPFFRWMRFFEISFMMRTKIRYFHATAYAPSLAHDPLASDVIVWVRSS
jgi:hypothetical protein